MRTAIEEIIIYSYEDILLPEHKKLLERVLDKHRRINVDDDFGVDSWYQYTINEWEELLEQKGYFDIKISFSGFWSQGDGASFTGRVDASDWLEKNPSDKYKRIKHLIKAKLVDDYIGEIKRDRWHNYVHWNTTSTYINFQIMGNSTSRSYPNIEKLLSDLENRISEQQLELNKDIYTSLEKEYERLTSTEVVLETLKQYEFTEDGSLVTELDYPNNK